MVTKNTPRNRGAKPAETRLRGRSLTYARLAWSVIALFYLGSFLAALPYTLTQRYGFAQQSLGWPEDDTRSSLAQLGLSLEAFEIYDTWSNLTITLVFFGLGFFIFWRRSDDPTALLFSLLFITFPGAAIFSALARLHPAWQNVREVTDGLSSMTLIALLVFPDGRFVPRWTRWLALGVILVQGWRLFRPDDYREIAPMFQLTVLVAILLVQIYRYRRVSTPTERQQTKWVVFGYAAGLTPLLIYLLIFFSNPAYDKPGALGMAMFLLGNFLWSLSLVSLVLSVTLAILRSRLWDIDVVIRRTLVYGGLTLTLALVYFGSIIILQGLIKTITGEAQSPVATVLSTLAIYGLFTPLRLRIQTDIDRRFYRQKYDAQKTLEGFADRARHEVELEPLTAQLLTVVQETIHPEHVSLWLSTTDERRPAQIGD